VNTWEPTHDVGAGAAAVWAAPDPAEQPVAQLEPGHAVVVADTRGGWAEVVLESGFRGWVDSSLLVARGPPIVASPVVSPSPRRRGPAIAIGALVVVGLVVALVLTRGGSDKDAATTSRSRTNSGPVRYKVPAGWSTSDDGLTIAEDEADLTAATPSGPRIRAVVGAEEDDDPIALMNETLSDASFDIVEAPTEIKISGVAAVSVTLRKDNMVLRFIGTHSTDGEGIVFTVVCPAERFDELRNDLEAAPGLAA
jgi:hypothetical protein